MIRLRPVGKKGQRSFQIIINERAKDVFGDYLEKLGHYNPNPTPAIIELKTERIKYWLSQGAQVSETVHNLLIDAGLLKGEKIRKGNANRGKKSDSASAPASAAASAEKVEVKPAAGQSPAKIEAKAKPEVKTEAKPEVKHKAKPTPDKPQAEVKTEAKAKPV